MEQCIICGSREIKYRNALESLKVPGLKVKICLCFKDYSSVFKNYKSRSAFWADIEQKLKELEIKGGRELNVTLEEAQRIGTKGIMALEVNDGKLHGHLNPRPKSLSPGTIRLPSGRMISWTTADELAAKN
ncbi:MAG: hypothetical protein Q7R46_00090 [bacterium]|nr:hypothetical protein [bacterium]